MCFTRMRLLLKNDQTAKIRLKVIVIGVVLLNTTWHLVSAVRKPPRNICRPELLLTVFPSSAMVKKSLLLTIMMRYGLKTEG